MASTVTIDRGYFETLLRRAEFHTDGTDERPLLQLPLVKILKSEYAALLQSAQEYVALKEALYEGGVSPEALDVIIQANLSRKQEAFTPGRLDPAAPSFVQSHVAQPPQIPSPHAALPVLKASPSPRTSWVDGSVKKPSLGRQGHSCTPTEQIRNTESQAVWQVHTDRPHSTGPPKRTLLLQNLGENVSHKDILEVMRGGAILDIYLRPFEKSASVSFVEPDAAQAFLRFTRREEVYINSKRIDVSFAERAFKPAHNVLRQISHGATRNLVVRGISSEVTEMRIRDDLHHIHGLVIVDIDFSKGDMFLSFNAIRLALFARTCLRSQSMYRKCSIEFYADQCAEPLPAVSTRVRSPDKTTHKSRPSLSNRLQSFKNRFQLLSLDGTEDGFEDFDDDNVSGYDSQ